MDGGSGGEIYIIIVLGWTGLVGGEIYVIIVLGWTGVVGERYMLL